ncbi:MAG TPA: lipoprotein signal peptidase [Porphyromonadaceae bacterium]|nr:lipoprotein signal peptidase [Porphyromonadaceae bacterium]
MALSKTQHKCLWGAVLAVFLLLIVDQASKIWIKTHMQLYESIEIFSWFKIYFTENPGMAFGLEIVDTYILTIFRIIVVSFLGVFIYKLIKQNFKFGFIMCLSLILAGALGNIIDCTFYGVLFDTSYGQVATFMPEGGGYSTFLHGKVVDMLYFPLIKTTWPSWMPFWAGQELIFFRPIFNIADSSICVSVFILLLFYRHSLSVSISERKKVHDG